ncbi:hypothetical protein EJ04DRAFT_63 [Polyplosphaeria fusca]|uniref:Uncharacterized protein n=1 Tax=Polyplosphaeria fusca TaxID=682080 RepID=A0A9P4R8L9_9PLEO|nr:hypothetical protein EJ04DRAFT_63 [Polyplosphaeria fusca]
MSSKLDPIFTNTDTPECNPLLPTPPRRAGHALLVPLKLWATRREPLVKDLTQRNDSRLMLIAVEAALSSLPTSHPLLSISIAPCLSGLLKNFANIGHHALIASRCFLVFSTLPRRNANQVVHYAVHLRIIPYYYQHHQSVSHHVLWLGHVFTAAL